jgi:hypothetical protein
MRGRGKAGNTHGMTTAEGLDIEESEDLVALKQLKGRDIS